MANPEVCSTRIEDGVAVITLGSEKRIFFDPEMTDALFEALSAASINDTVRAIIVTGGAPGYFVRHYSVAELVKLGETLQKTDQPWPEDALFAAKRDDGDAVLDPCRTHFRVGHPNLPKSTGLCRKGSFPSEGESVSAFP